MVYHSKEFTEKCKSLGLHPKLGEGYHLKMADGPFEILWCCPECGMNVRMGISDAPKFRHHTCEKPDGLSVFLVPGDVYVAKK
jgi:hypothetical protein